MYTEDFPSHKTIMDRLQAVQLIKSWILHKKQTILKKTLTPVLGIIKRMEITPESSKALEVGLSLWTISSIVSFCPMLLWNYMSLGEHMTVLIPQWFQMRDWALKSIWHVITHKHAWQDNWNELEHNNRRKVKVKDQDKLLFSSHRLQALSSFSWTNTVFQNTIICRRGHTP